MFKGDRNFAVGLFVTIAIAVFIVFVLWLTGRSGVEDTKRYTLLFDNNISGLSVGGRVNFMGMNIGSVVRMRIEQQEDIRVRVDIEVLESTPVNNGTFASLALQGITGVAVINLASEPGSHGPLKREPGQEYPVIPVRVVGFSAVLSSAPEIMAKLDHLLTQASRFLGAENRESVNTTLKNMEDLTASLSERREALAALPSELNKTLAEIQATVARLNGVVAELEPGMAGTVDSLQQSSENLVKLSARLDSMLLEHEDEIRQFMQNGMSEIPAAMQDARQTLREMDKLLRELQRNPSQLIHRPAQETVEIDP